MAKPNNQPTNKLSAMAQCEQLSRSAKLWNCDLYLNLQSENGDMIDPQIDLIDSSGLTYVLTHPIQ